MKFATCHNNVWPISKSNASTESARIVWRLRKKTQDHMAQEQKSTSKTRTFERKIMHACNRRVKISQIPRNVLHSRKQKSIAPVHSALFVCNKSAALRVPAQEGKPFHGGVKIQGQCYKHKDRKLPWNFRSLHGLQAMKTRQVCYQRPSTLAALLYMIFSRTLEAKGSSLYRFMA